MGGIRYLEVFMKRFVFGMVLVLAVGLFVSCASNNKLYKPLVSGEEVIGTVRVNFEGPPDGIVGRHPVDIAAYDALLEEAKKKYHGNIEIRDINWFYVKAITPRKILEYSGEGKIVLLNGGGGNAAILSGVEGALARASEELSEKFTAQSRIAIVITAEDRSQTDFIAGELEHLLRRQGFVIIDRSDLDKIRAKQQFGLSGEVDDATAVSIGKIAGANIIVTGRVDGEGNLRRLRLRALDTTTGQVVGTASEKL
jgi:hypothetical protein